LVSNPASAEELQAKSRQLLSLLNAAAGTETQAPFPEGNRDASSSVKPKKSAQSPKHPRRNSKKPN